MQFNISESRINYTQPFSSSTQLYYFIEITTPPPSLRTRISYIENKLLNTIKNQWWSCVNEKNIVCNKLNKNYEGIMVNKYLR